MEVITFKYEESSGISHDDIKKTVEGFSDYRKRLEAIRKEGGYHDPESSLNLPFDQEMHRSIHDTVKNLKTPTLKYIIHIGIGGSSLGTQALYDAHFGTLDLFIGSRFPKIIFVDTNNSSHIKTIRELLRGLESSDEVSVTLASKLGGTTESIANFETIHQLLKERFGEVGHRVVVITDKNSKLWIAAEGEKFTLLPIPENVGGRFSVLSAAGLFSLALAGIDTDAIRAGASVACENSLSEDMNGNSAALSASILYLHHQKGISIHNSFFFDSKLESLGKWYRQLVGESLGKEYAVDGKLVHAGMTPIVSIGSNDLHSVGQLYLGGPKDKFTTFISVEKTENNTHVPDRPILTGLVDGIAGKSFEQIMSAIYQGVRAAYLKRALPFVEVAFPELSPKTLGAFMQFKMMETMYLAHLMGLNAFDQPNVEEYKEETRNVLRSS